MFRKRLTYRLLSVFLVFALAFMVPLFLRFSLGIDAVFDSIDQHQVPVEIDISQVREELKSELYDDLVVLSVYMFFVAFIISLFFSRNLLLPVRQLFRGAEAVRRGDFDVELPVVSQDELGEVTEVFNRMARTLKSDTEELKKKELYIKTMMDAMWVLDMDDNIVDVNPAFSKLFGYERDEVVGVSIYDFVDDENAVIMRFEMGKRTRGDESSAFQISLIAKTGENIPVLITASPIIESGEVRGKIGIIKDFSEQAGLMKKLLESKKHIESIMNSIDDKMLLVDRDFRIINANEKALEIYGDDIIGKKCYTVGHTSDKPCWVSGEDCPVQNVLIRGGTWKTVHRHPDRTGQMRYDEIVACPVKDMEGEIRFVVELIRDVTESKKYEDTISKKNRELMTINEISTIISSSMNAQAIYMGVIDKLAGILDMDGGGVYIIDEDRKVLSCVFHKGVSDDFIEKAGRVRMGEDIPGRVAVTGEGIMVPDVSKDYRVERSILKFSGVRGYCCIPVRGKERILGVICLFSFHEHYFTEEEQRILTSVGKMVGIAAENINLYEKVKGLFDKQRRRLTRERKALLDLASTVSESIDIDELKTSTVKLVRDFFHASGAWFARIHEDGNVTIESADGFDVRDSERRLPAGVYSIESAVRAADDYVVVPDIFTEKQYFVPEPLTRSNFRTVISVPVKVRNRVFGVMSIFFRNVTTVRDDDVHFMLIVSSILSVAIETADLYEKRIMDRGLAEAVFDNMSEGVCTVDTEGCVTSVNRAASRILNMSAAAMVGRHYTEVIPHENDPASCPVSASLKGRHAEAVIRLAGPGDYELTLQISSSPLVDLNGEVRGAVQVIRDITKSRQIEEMKSDLIRRVSHEFRTPLSAIVGMTEMLITGDVRGKRGKQYLETILNEGMRLSSMVSDLLDLSRIESGKVILEMTEVPVREMIEAVLHSLEPSIRQKEAEVSLHIDGGVEFVVADRTKIAQVLLNLVSNSLAYSDRNVKIDIFVKKERDYIIIQVQDNGWGMTEDDLSHAGEKFFRGRLSASTKGTGLGLALCREIMELHDGSIELESRVEEGTTVSIKLPARSMKNA